MLLMQEECENREHTIYALQVQLAAGLHCYVGQTVNFRRRMTGHLQPHENSSAKLLRLARGEEKPVEVVTLDIVFTNTEANELEGMWTWKAFRKGIILPNVEKWWKNKRATEAVQDERDWPTPAGKPTLLREFYVPEWEMERRRQYYRHREAHPGASAY